MEIEETEVEESPNTATAPEPSSAAIARSARPVLVRLAELEPLAMTALSSCAQPVTDTAEGRAGEDESHGGVTDRNGENRPNDQSYCRDADMDGVLGVCHKLRLSKYRKSELPMEIQNSEENSFNSLNWSEKTN